MSCFCDSFSILTCPTSQITKLRLKALPATWHVSGHLWSNPATMQPVHSIYRPPLEGVPNKTYPASAFGQTNSERERENKQVEQEGTKDKESQINEGCSQQVVPRVNKRRAQADGPSSLCGPHGSLGILAV